MTYDERIYQRATSDGIPPVLATIIVAQAMHETGGYTSNAFESCNNCFGYKWVGQASALGPCILSSEGDSYAKYNSIEQSVDELVGWIQRRQKEGTFPKDLATITSPEQYAGLLYNKGYFGYTSSALSNYIKGLTYWLNQISATLSTPGMGIGLTLAIIAIILILQRKK